MGRMKSLYRERTTAEKPGFFLWRFSRNRKGSVAVEFAALIIPFSLLIFAILESCISFAAQELLALSADRVARQVRTGQIKPADLNEAKLREMICGNINILVSDGCPGLEVDLREFATFALAAKERIEFTADGDIDTNGFAVTPGPALSKNMLRVFYRWPVMTDFMRKSMSNLNDGKTLHFASVTWQNEPFDD
jgi:Flp pilus assembly protein TadG